MATESTALPPSSREEFLSRLRVPRARSHNHRSVDEVMRELHVGPVERLLLWLSKTDVYVLALSSQYTRLTLASLGMMVLFTSLLAFASGLYAILSMLIDPESPARWPIALVLAGVYGFGIMIIDREIVGSMSMKSLPIRLLFAVGIATAVSYPVKIKFFEGRVKAEVSAMVAERNADKLQRVRELEQTGEAERMEGRRQIQARIVSLDREIGLLDAEIDKEATNVRCGPRCQAFRAQKNEVMARRVAAEAELSALAGPSTLPADIRAEVERLRAEFEQEVKDSYDFLSKWEALGRIKRDPAVDYEVLSWFVFGFFILLELVPLGLKWSLGKAEYNYYIETRANLNKQKIIALNNVFMELMQRDPGAVLDFAPMEITDLIAAVMEDELMNTGDEPSLRRLMESIRRDLRDGAEREQASTPPGAVRTAGVGPFAVPPTGRTGAPDTQDDPLAPRA